jgi:MSHA biogenesis protein MshJ
MKMPAGLRKGAARFDQLSLRERALVSGAVLVAVVMIWMLAVFDKATAKQVSIRSEIANLQESIAATAASVEGATGSEAMCTALAREVELKGELAQVDGKLANQQAGLITPDRMVQVIHDVLSHQRGVRLVSLHNLPVTTLVPPKPPAPAEGDAQPAADGSTPAPDASADAKPAALQETGPYVHPVELVVEGEYLDVLAYLQALEHLPWRFYWKLLALETTEYPTNRVRVELATLSMEKDWIGM